MELPPSLHRGGGFFLIHRKGRKTRKGVVKTTEPTEELN